jgi:AraC-like DNA-binding protein
MEKIPVRNIRTTEERSAGRFSIRKIENIMGSNEMNHELHRHNFFFILAVNKGEGVHEIDFTPFKVTSQSVFFLRPGQVHQLYLKPGSTGYLVEFDSLFARPKNKPSTHYLRKASNKNLCKVESARFAKLDGILSNMFNELSAKAEGYLDVIKAELEIFCIELNRQSVDPKRVAREEGLYAKEKFEQFFELLENKISEMKNASQYAELLHLSAYQLNAITKAVAGKTATQLIEEQVMLEAKRYLIATPNQIKDIAWNLGYEDVSYFIRFFKKRAGQSPEAFRKDFK